MWDTGGEAREVARWMFSSRSEGRKDVINSAREDTPETSLFEVSPPGTVHMHTSSCDHFVDAESAIQRKFCRH